MKVTAHYAKYVPGKSPIVLGDNLGGVCITNYRVSTSLTEEMIPLPEQEWIETFIDRGNRFAKRSFDADRDHGDDNIANAFVEEHGSEVPGLADIEIEYPNYTGAVVTRWLRGASISSADCQSNQSQSTKFTYFITSGKPYSSQS